MMLRRREIEQRVIVVNNRGTMPGTVPGLGGDEEFISAVLEAVQREVFCYYNIIYAFDGCARLDRDMFCLVVALHASHFA
jgi:hypothetical protein